MTGEYDRPIRDLEDRVDSLESDLRSLNGKFGYTEHLDDELRSIRSDISDAEGKLEEIENDLGSHITDTNRTLKRLIGQVQLLEGRLLASGVAQLADLDTFTDEQRQLARAMDRGRQASSLLLNPYERSMHQQRVQHFETTVAQHRQHRTTVIAAVGKLTRTGAPRERGSAAAELAKALEQERRLRQDLDRQAGLVEAADIALAADAKARAEQQDVIAAGQKAEQKLILALRSRLADAISDRAVLPAWFVTVLGSAPPATRTQEWLETATQVLLYRLTHSVTDAVVALGDKPAGGARRAEWYEQLAKDLRRW
ncbi:hypothetical protein [Streptomyces sp. AV19]|uniref:hypothetical protein n=1 Tax=Streptomyces sp. AV19 TaxID=2793068 RepID=UPI001F25CC61|nr:hypothetical protein [Streptomyces sp. AV19]MDG4537116.1 hypothetical protein [Streptomyces sp. AV19]